MKKLLLALSMFVAVAFTTNSAKAQITATDVNTAVGNLVAVNGVDVNVVLQNININDVIDVDISNVLNNNDIRVLTDFLKNITIDNVLNNLLRDADILNNNQVVIGILNGVLLVTDQSNLKGAKK